MTLRGELVYAGGENCKCENIVDFIGRCSLVVGWDILGLDVRAHSKPKLVYFVLALQAPGGTVSSMAKGGFTVVQIRRTA